MRYCLLLVVFVFISSSCNFRLQSGYDFIIRNGWIYDGLGGSPYQADIAIQADSIAAIGNLENATAKEYIDATGLAIAPGFINMLSWADKSLLMDGRSMSDIKQGVTLEIFGEGFSPGPVRRNLLKPIDSLYTTLDDYFNYALKKGVSPNIASFVGASSVRMYVLDQENRPPTAIELEQMKQLVHEAMQQGALGLGTSLIYAPANYASTEELIELAKVASSYGGIYITHLRSEADQILNALDEAILIGNNANIPVEIYHLKVNIPRNWPKLDDVIKKIDSANRSGVKVTANMYPYVASATGLNSRVPTWALEGGGKEMRKRLKNPRVRAKVLYEMNNGIPYPNSDPSCVVLTGFRLDSLNRIYKGKRLDEASKIHGKSVDETTLDLIIKDKSRVEAIYYLQSEENIRKVMKLPFVSFGSDAGSLADTPMFDQLAGHPRAFGTFARVLGKYAREEKILTLEEAIRRMTSLPAENLTIQKRGALKKGYFADIVIFDAALIKDLATFESPKKYSEGMLHVFINGRPVLQNGAHTGAKPGRVIRGQGWKKNAR